MKQRVLVFFFLYFVPWIGLNSNPSLSPSIQIVSESTSKELAKIGEEIQYKIQVSGAVDWQLPKAGSYSRPGEILPWLEISQISIQEDSLQLTLVYYQTGKQDIPIGWKAKDTPSNQIEYTKKTIEIQSTLAGNEEDLYDIHAPIDFVGFPWRKFFFWTFVVLVVCLVATQIYKKWKAREDVYDAEWKQMETPSLPAEDYTASVEAFFTQDTIPAKEFGIALTQYFKARLQKQTKKDISHLTDTELQNEFTSLLSDDRDNLPHRIESLRYWKFGDKPAPLTLEEAKEAFQFFKRCT